ncbi:phosphonate C-P lyase system protein PhnH [Microvirga lenta]|uniref:phosphonate C-P lyase system protein PhnH n=1 Tax=Microvirga lenta TaxID=2881337 RepID=UPI001CFCC9A1|nr:phosphonate C-P lyase system protein PhnH [Microvirga lenta]MCB5173968.1 phosphonate C-P lyase system protein PhnH [Microvirga lenta]
MTALAHGFGDPVTDAQQVFHAAMNALARPGRPQPLTSGLEPPRPMTPELAAIALALADHEAPIWLDPALAAASGAADFLRFHTGAAVVADPGRAAFALIADPGMPLPVEQFALGTAEFPDRSTTLVIAVEDLSDTNGWVLRGPGIADRQSLLAAPWPHALADIVRLNSAVFPRGLDVLLAAPGRIVGLPRSTRFVEEI